MEREKDRQMGSVLPTSTAVHDAENPKISQQPLQLENNTDAGALFVLKSKGIDRTYIHHSYVYFFLFERNVFFFH